MNNQIKPRKGFIVQIRSRHPSHAQFRNKLRLPFRSVVRFGSTTPMRAEYVFLNSADAVSNSASKVRMKRCFTDAGVKTAEWCLGKDIGEFIKKVKFPIIAKSEFGSRGEGLTFIENQEGLDIYIRNHGTAGVIFEKYYGYAREYRLHVTVDGCFYTCRKMLKEGTPKRWCRNDANCAWMIEENPLFDRPKNWEEIETECIKALKAVGLDFGACDVRVQSAKENGDKSPNFVIIEINSAPSMGKITYQRYLEMIPKMLTKKRNS